MSIFPLSTSDDQSKSGSYSDHEKELLDKVAKKVVHWKMTVPAIMTLESVKPLNFIGSQAMVFFEPVVQTLLNLKDYDTFREMLERRETIELLLLRIEHFDAMAHRKEKHFTKLKKEFLKTQSFVFRLKSAIVGFKVPKHLEESWKAQIETLEKQE